MYRQGDILIRKVRRIPKEARVLEGTVLAHGEQTGHTHALANPEARVLGTDTDIYFTVAIPTPLEHPEHATVTIPPGDWQVVRQREYFGERKRTRPHYD